MKLDELPLIVAEGGRGKGKKVRNAEIVPAGRMVTLTRVRAKDIPDTDRGGSDANISDPYLTFALVNASGEKMDETRTPHIENTRSPRWLDDTYRLFFPDDEAKTTKTAPASLLITLMDKNKKKADEFIGEVVVSLNVG